MIENARSLDRTASVLLLLGMVYVLGPLYFVLATASQSYDFVVGNGIAWLPGNQLLVNVGRIFTETDIPVQLLNSIIVAFACALGSCTLSFLSAYAIVFFRRRWAGAVFALILASIMLPLDIRVITTYQVAANVLEPVNWLADATGLSALLAKLVGEPLQLQWNILDTYFGLTAPLVAHGMGTFLLRQSFLTLPGDLLKAARMDGAGPIRFMVDILLPLSRASFASLFVLTFLYGWTAYMWPLVASSTPDMQTAVIGLARLNPSMSGMIPDYPLIAAGVVAVSVIPLAMIALLQRYLVRGLVLSEK